MFLLHAEVWGPLLMTFLRIWTVKRKKKKTYLMPIFSPVQSHINSKFAILAFLYYRYVFGNRVQNTFYDKKKLGGGGQFSYLAQHLRKICDYLCILMSNIYLISLRDGITGPLIKLRWFQEDLETSPDYILDLLKPLSGLRTMLTKIKTFSSNPRKALISDWLNKCVQRSLIWQNCIQPLHWV